LEELLLPLLHVLQLPLHFVLVLVDTQVALVHVLVEVVDQRDLGVHHEFLLVHYLGDVFHHRADGVQLAFSFIPDILAGFAHADDVLALVLLEVLREFSFKFFQGAVSVFDFLQH